MHLVFHFSQFGFTFTKEKINFTHLIIFELGPKKGGFKKKYIIFLLEPYPNKT